MTGRLLLLSIVLYGAAAARAEAVQIVTPADGAVVRSGATVTVRVAASSEEQIQEVVFSTREGSIAVPAGGLQGDVPIPLDAVGPEFIIVSARLADGGISIAFVEIVADPGPLRRLVATGPPALTTIGQLATLDVRGVFADDVVRNLSDADAGTTFTSSDAALLGVHPNGIVQARGRGLAQVVITNRGRSAVVTIPVTVPNPADNRIPVPSAGSDRIVAPEALVTLDAAGTNDPDGDSLRLDWQQIKGPAVLLRDPTTAAPYFVAPRVGAETILEFALTATDDKGATSFPSIVRVTVKP